MNAVKIAYKPYDYVLVKAYFIERLPATGYGELLRTSNGSLELVVVRDSTGSQKRKLFVNGLSDVVKTLYKKMYNVDSAIKRISSALIRVSPEKMIGPVQICSYIGAAWGCESACSHSTMSVMSHLPDLYEIETTDADGKAIRVLVIYADAEEEY